MDILDPLDTSIHHTAVAEDVHHEAKVMINRTVVSRVTDVEEQNMESDDDEDQRVVDHLSPQTLLETPPDEVQYSYRSPEGTVTYGVLKVEDGVEHVPQIVTTATTNFANASGNVQQVLTNNLNGQLYVISPNEVFVSHQSGTRAIAPRSTISTDGSSLLNSNMKKRDERRRATHNEVERRRRDKINNWILKLSKIIPDGNSSAAGEVKGNGHYEGQSKGGILAKACQYIQELQECQRNMESVKQRNLLVERENRELKELLKKHGITEYAEQVVDQSSLS